MCACVRLLISSRVCAYVFVCYFLVTRVGLFISALCVFCVCICLKIFVCVSVWVCERRCIRVCVRISAFTCVWILKYTCINVQIIRRHVRIPSHPIRVYTYSYSSASPKREVQRSSSAPERNERPHLPALRAFAAAHEIDPRPGSSGGRATDLGCGRTPPPPCSLPSLLFFLS